MKRLLSALLTVSFVFVLGCGGKGSPASLNGQVTFAKTPIENGDIRLDPIEKSDSQAAAAKITGGKYEIRASSGLKAGKFQVSVYSFRETGKSNKDPETGKVVPVTEQSIPEKYNRNSTLTVDVKPGENTQDFNLE